MARIFAVVLLAAASTCSSAQAATVGQRKVQRRYRNHGRPPHSNGLVPFTARRIGDAQPRSETPAPAPEYDPRS